jgi:transcriptional regulator with XRE-family HTH domain
MYFATNLYYLRRKRNLSQTELGDLVGVDYATIGRYERSAALPKLQVITQLAQLFGVTIEELRDVDLRQPATTEVQEPATEYVSAAVTLLPAPAKHKVIVAVELDGTADCLTRAFARLTSFNKIVAATE